MRLRRDANNSAAKLASSTRRQAREEKPARGRRSQARLGTRFDSTAGAAAIASSTPSRPPARAARRTFGTGGKVAASIAVLVLVASLVYVFVSPNWYVWDVEVSGTRWLPKEDVVSLVNVVGMSIFYVDPGSMAAALEGLPSVERARVTCRLPGQVEVYLVERQPAGIWQSQGVQYWVDGQGALFPLAGELDDPLVIVEQDAVSRQPGEVVDAAILSTALAIRDLVPEARIFGYSAQDGLSFDLLDGKRVLVPAQTDAARKVASLNAMQDYLRSEDIDYAVIDLRYDGRAFWR